MPVSDSITGWFIRNILLPNAEDIRSAGFVLSKFSEGGQTISLREFFFPESFYTIFETKIAKKLGKKGEQSLYSVGKKFGHRYAKLSYFKKSNQLDRKHFEDFMYMFTRYIEVIYAKKLSHKIIHEKKLIELTADSYVGCEKNGLGYLLLIGAWTGGWSFLMDDPHVEGVQTKCQGRGDKECKLICAPESNLKKSGLSVLCESSLDDLQEDYKTYSILNQVYPTVNNNYSLRELIENKIFDYQSGKLFYNKERMVGIEASMYYMVDNGFSKNKITKVILFESAFDSGKAISAGKDILFVQRFLAGIGFGDVQVVSAGKNYEVAFNHFPWTVFSQDCDFTLLSGFTSGMLSGCSNKKIILSKVSKIVGGDGFHVRLA
ncbi:Uncharacterised protein [Candidatus Bilamarchaeum dharawalense]|uniref:Uncharacterized protein n=1 Tax=Candidatus Bilamarchaeum dharawalense TaxID=2885759 RepID=A0A5E4LPR9_9ARCH|nr:Uncharacterised protein [Candidatus Bilamarchaeum dharawalense]